MCPSHRSCPLGLKLLDSVQFDYQIRREIYKQIPGAISLFKGLHFKASPQEAAFALNASVAEDTWRGSVGIAVSLWYIWFCSSQRLQLCIFGK